MPFDFDDIIFGELFGIPVRRYRPTEEKRCTLCGSTFEDIAASGKIGCAKCYEVFENELAGTIEKIHGRAVHSGRAPKK